ncbi:uncharacterized protein FA14DRAFT_176310 [Meira miltonrushii]|uniref:Uncharacterized protein n=1 Tax=Meira miltonrushii TaxID=1280837 RepID=A0A316VIX2_9BASI|nr:uncharacterized protein FA14DRAFT_176310 [Meira miltonrushii]PWN37008.1 hypothetical protein FA14DRAFT_176310 [Meira miltonrushii]
MLPVKGIIFIGLNVLRTISMIALILVFSSTILLMVNDSNTYYRLRNQDLLQTSQDECDYYPESDVPTTTWGMFWIQLDRFWILCLCITCFFSEFGIKFTSMFFHKYIPILGPSFGTMPLGVIQVIISSSLLSHYVKGFTLATPWLLFFVGLLNTAAGIGFGYRGKLRRSLNRSKRDLHALKQQKDLEKAVPFGTAIRTLANTSIDEAHTLMLTHQRTSKSVKSKYSRHSGEHASLLQGGAAPSIRPVRSAKDAFPNTSADAAYGAALQGDRIANQPNPGNMSVQNEPLSASDDEVLRWRARQDNLRVEREQETKENGTQSSFFRDFRYDLQNDMAIPVRTPSVLGPMEPTSKQWQSQAAQAQDDAVQKKQKFKRRTLVLSRVVQQVRRGSLAAYQATKSAQMRMPGAYRTNLKPKEKPTPWVEVDSSNKPKDDTLHPPAPTYIPGRPQMISVGKASEDNRTTRYHTPITDKFANML